MCRHHTTHLEFAQEMWYLICMEVPKKNALNLRKTLAESREKGNAATKKTLAEHVEKASVLHAFKVSEEKNPANLLILGVTALLGIALIAYFAFSGNYLAAFFFLLAGMLVAYGIYQKKPREVICKIRVQGVQINRDLYPYETLKSFWIFYDPPHHQELSIRSRKAFTGGYIKISLGDEDPVKIREILIKFLPERKQEEALVDVFARLVGL